MNPPEKSGVNKAMRQKVDERIAGAYAKGGSTSVNYFPAFTSKSTDRLTVPEN